MTLEHAFALMLLVFLIAFLWGEIDGARRQRDKTRSRRLRRRISLYVGTPKDW